MCSSGTIALRIEFSTTCRPVDGGAVNEISSSHSPCSPLHLLGTPETSRSGRSTRNARRAFTSKPSFIMVDSAVLTALQQSNSGRQRRTKQRSAPSRTTRPTHSPDHDDGEVEQVPRVAQVRAAVHHEPVRDDLHHALDREYHEEHVLHLLLRSERGREKRGSQSRLVSRPHAARAPAGNRARDGARRGPLSRLGGKWGTARRARVSIAASSSPRRTSANIRGANAFKRAPLTIGPNRRWGDDAPPVEATRPCRRGPCRRARAGSIALGPRRAATSRANRSARALSIHRRRNLSAAGSSVSGVIFRAGARQSIAADGRGMGVGPWRGRAACQAGEAKTRAPRARVIAPKRGEGQKRDGDRDGGRAPYQVGVRDVRVSVRVRRVDGERHAVGKDGQQDQILERLEGGTAGQGSSAITRHRYSTQPLPAPIHRAPFSLRTM